MGLAAHAKERRRPNKERSVTLTSIVVTQVDQIASSPIFAEHGITIAAAFDADPQKVGTTLGGVPVSSMDELDAIVRDRSIVVGVLAVPTEAAQQAADRLIDAGVKIIFNYTQALIDSPSDVQVHTSNPAVELLYALYFHLT